MACCGHLACAMRQRAAARAAALVARMQPKSSACACRTMQARRASEGQPGHAAARLGGRRHAPPVHQAAGCRAQGGAAVVGGRAQVSAGTEGLGWMQAELAGSRLEGGRACSSTCVCAPDQRPHTCLLCATHSMRRLHRAPVHPAPQDIRRCAGGGGRAGPRAARRQAAHADRHAGAHGRALFAAAAAGSRPRLKVV